MVRKRGGTRRQSGYPAARQWQESRCRHVLTVEMNLAWGGVRRVGWVYKCHRCCCSRWSTLLSHSCIDQSRNQKGQRSLSEGETGQQKNGHDDSEKKGYHRQTVSFVNGAGELPLRRRPLLQRGYQTCHFRKI